VFFFLIFHIVKYFWQNFTVSCHIPGPFFNFLAIIRSYILSFSFSGFWVFLAIFHFLFLCFSFSKIFSFLAIFQVLVCAFLIFNRFHCF
jgi:hypothetical protein